MLTSRDFRPELFREPEEYEEGPLRERKQQLYELQRVDKKGEFVRDLIALANTAQAFGDYAYILLGLTDSGKLRDLTPDLESYERVHAGKTKEVIKKQIDDVIEEYITPPLINHKLKWQEIDNKQVAYLLIPPQSLYTRFYKVKKSLKSGKKVLLHQGSSWLRFGENKHKIDLDAIALDDFRIIIPYVNPSRWKQYLTALVDNREIREAQDVVMYQELTTAEENQPLQNVVEEFLEGEDGRLMVLIGKAGCGKSLFLKRLVYYWAEDGLRALEDIRRREKFRPPPKWVPLYFSLRGFKADKREVLEEELTRAFNNKAKLWSSVPEGASIFIQPYQPHLHVRWLVCLDGLDEVSSRDEIRVLTGVLREFCRRYPYVKVLLTTRPDFTISLERSVEITGLSREQIDNYLRYYVKEEDLYESVAYLINGNEDLRNLCAVPLYLEAIANVVSAEVIPQLEKETAVWDTGVVAELDKVGVERPEDRALSEIPRISVEELIITEPLRKEREAAVREEGSEEEEQLSPYVSLAQVLDRAIDRVWSREFNRGVFSNEKVHEYWDGLGKLACAIDGRGQAKRKAVVVGEFVPEAGLSPILSLGILCQERGWIKFITSLVQLYFAACFLLLYVQNEAVDEAQEYITTFKPGFRVQVKSFLSELSYEPLDTLFPEVQQ